jgi:hypothetical protein
LGKTHIYRLDVPVWRRVIVQSDCAAINDIANAPLRVEKTEVEPSLSEERSAQRTFLHSSVQQPLTCVERRICSISLDFVLAAEQRRQ